MRFLGDGKRIAVAVADSPKSAESIVYDSADGKASAHSKFQSVKDQIFVIDVNADASQVLMEDRSAKVFLWDVKASEVWSFEQPAASFPLPFTADGKHFIMAGSQKAELRDTSSGKVVAEFPHPGPKFSGFNAAAGVSSDGKLAIRHPKSSSIDRP